MLYIINIINKPDEHEDTQVVKSYFKYFLDVAALLHYEQSNVPVIAH